MQALIEKIIKSRESSVKAGDFTFTVRRPTDLQASLYSGHIRQSEILRDYVAGWKGVKESDIIPGGTADEVPFTPGLFIEWIADRPELWSKIVTEITESYARHQEKLSAAEKKP